VDLDEGSIAHPKVIACSCRSRSFVQTGHTGCLEERGCEFIGWAPPALDEGVEKMRWLGQVRPSGRLRY
jgi:hypothetical protein